MLRKLALWRREFRVRYYMRNWQLCRNCAEEQLADIDEYDTSCISCDEELR